MTIKDDMSLVQKGVYILKKGIDIQKRAVCQSQLHFGN